MSAAPASVKTSPIVDDQHCALLPIKVTPLRVALKACSGRYGGFRLCIRYCHANLVEANSRSTVSHV